MNLLKYKKLIDQQLVDKLIGYLSKPGKHKIMIGITGEVNSLVAGAILKQALRQTQGKLEEDVVVMVFDFGTDYTNKLVDICNQLALNTYILKRGNAYQSEVSAYRFHKPADIKNFYQRFINYHLFIQADNMKATIIDTIDKSDRLLGTRPIGFYGHLMPFYSLYKSELYDLASFLQIPIDKSLTFQDITFDKLDPILYLLTEKQLSPEDISQQFNIDLDWLKKLKNHVNKQLFQTPVSQFII